ncbi:T9SS type A sorting domain-containing protein [Chryseobacterium balustinum]|uniref:Por secretion system C-terminal sorting domain n=1 Tax=Chryseobacterium balustinum TaxID=246 RepID=A0AAX2IRL0_9FLAO|nr:T9SS type A sorting domain-containing protein [Chryseobacterium balustinum]AZB28333.1 T9SS C-terminal target domain-containing protein [Chryseobacterium balustinum]SKC12066.1 Por secretion system C-terminal sorting domain-containing protein [Chryseobacterium balustinum]SQA92752.1 Por secretion system C-terminal sorting domain [Chryseobacterium balustinum]
MKIKLLSLVLTFTLSISVFSQDISFESSEGYVLGDINNQQGWTSYGSATPNTATIINTTSTLGTNSANVLATNTINDGGIKKNVNGFAKTELSFDFKISAIDESDYFMSVRDNSNTILGAFVIDYEQGNVAIYDGIMDDVTETSIDVSPNVWYNFKMIVNTTTHTVEYFVNNTSLGSKNFLTTTTGFQIIDFAFDDYDSGFTVDNIKISNADNLSTSEIAQDKKINIYPNPTSDFLHVPTTENIKSLEVYDLSGKVVLKDTSGKNQISVSFLNKGMYIIKITTNHSVFSTKFSKK